VLLKGLVGAFDEEATGCETKGEDPLVALKGEDTEENAPKVACGFLAGADSETVTDSVDPERLFASRTLAAMPDDNEDPTEVLDRADDVGLADAKGDAAAENAPKVA
jgi:hypothetical protein